MKKRNVNRIILLIMLLFGVVGCKEPPAVSEPTSNEEPTSQISEETPSEDPSEGEEEDWFVDVSPTYVRYLDELEHEQVMDGVVDKLENLVTFKSRAKQDSTDFEEPDILVSAWLNTDAEVYQKLGFVYDTELMVTTQHKGSSTVILEQHTKQNIVGAWSEGIHYQVVKTNYYDGRGECHSFYKEEISEEEMGPFSPIMFESTGLMLIEYCDVLLDENGEYHFVLEVVEQESQPHYSGQYVHAWTRIYIHISVNKEYEITSSYITQQVRKHILPTATPGDMTKLPINDELIHSERFTYGEVKEMPGIAEFVASYPISIFKEKAVVTTRGYAYSINGETGEIEIDTGTVLFEKIVNVKGRLDETGSFNGNYYGIDIKLDTGRAYEFDLKYEAVFQFNNGGQNVFVRNVNLDLSAGIPDELASSLKVVEFEDKHYLIYMPEGEGEPASIKLDIFFLIKLTPVLDELNQASGNLTLLDIVIELH